MENDHPVTHREFEAGLTAAKAEIQTELRAEMASLEERITDRMAALEERITDRLTEFARNIEASLLTAFHGYGRGQSSRLHTVEAGHQDLGLRVAALEDRVLALETRPRL